MFWVTMREAVQNEFIEEVTAEDLDYNKKCNAERHYREIYIGGGWSCDEKCNAERHYR